jgi:outer membrane protein assembly factor BamB
MARGYHHPMPGGALSVSSQPDGSEVIVWATYPQFDAFNPPITQAVPGTLYAFDGEPATNLINQIWPFNGRPVTNTINTIWSSGVGKNAVGEYAKFTPPTIANGHVYVATFDGKLQVYGLNPCAKGMIWNSAGGACVCPKGLSVCPDTGTCMTVRQCTGPTGCPPDAPPGTCK